MVGKNPYKIKLSFPSDQDYIPPIRKFIAEMLQVNDFTSKSAFRTEVIVDEICDNAINFGSLGVHSCIEIGCDIFQDRVELVIKDEGGNKDNVQRLHSVMIENKKESTDNIQDKRHGLGLEIVRMLAEDVKVEVDQNNLTSIRIVRKREN